MRGKGGCVFGGTDDLRHVKSRDEHWPHVFFPDGNMREYFACSRGASFVGTHAKQICAEEQEVL